MNENFLQMQDVQDTYAKWMNLNILICSLEGEIVTKVSWINHRTKIFAESYLGQESLRTFLQPFQELTKTTLVETKIGYKLILSPIHINNGKYFIIAGLIIDKGTDQEISEILLLNSNKFSVLSNSGISSKMDTITKLADVMAAYVSIKKATNGEQSFSDLVAEKIAEINHDKSTIDSILEVGMFFNEVDFMALATKQTNESFIVESHIGQKNECLVGYRFTIGKGLLGYSVARERPYFYRNINKDAPGLSLEQLKIGVKSLFTFPIVKNKTTIGLLFGGSIYQEIEKDPLFNKLTVCASLMLNHLKHLELKSRMQNQKTEIFIFNEVLKAFTSIEDPKIILLLLLDMTRNITQATFTSFTYKDRNQNIETLSRGDMDQEFLGMTAQRIQKGEVSYSGGINYYRDKDLSIIEIPFVSDASVYGFLTVGMKNNISFNQESIVSSLAMAGGLAIRFIGQRNLHNLRMFEIIHTLLKGYEPEKYRLREIIKKTALEFSKLIQNADLEQIDRLSSFAVFEWTSLETLLDDQDINLVRSYQQVLENKSDGNINAEIMAVIWVYYSNNRNVASLHHLRLINDQIRLKFISWISRNTYTEYEIAFENTLTEHPSNYTNLINQMNLTTRELEVLDNLVRGFSNKEISEALHISEHTVKNHMTKILYKLKVSDRSQAIAKAYQLGYSIIKKEGD